MIVHAYHGWASDASIWDQVALLLGSQVVLRRYDRGYFGLENDVSPNEQPDVILTHSMGLLFVPDTVFSAARRILVVNGFSFFPSSNPISQRRTLSMLALMKTNLLREPVAQVQSFCIKSGMRMPNITDEGVNIARLTADLDLLATMKVSADKIHTGTSVQFIHAMGDPIVNQSAIRETVSEFPKAQHHYVDTQSHNLPDNEAGLIRTLIFDP